MSLAENLAAARSAAGLSQRQVADALGTHQPKVSEIEHGQRAVNALELKVLAKLYGTTADALLDLSPPPNVRTPEGLMARLERVTSDLHSYLEHRARELAESHIKAAEDAAAARVRQVEAELQRRDDLVAELRRQVRAALRGQAHALHTAGLRHDKEYCEHCKTETVVVLR